MVRSTPTAASTRPCTCGWVSADESGRKEVSIMPSVMGSAQHRQQAAAGHAQARGRGGRMGERARHEG